MQEKKEKLLKNIEFEVIKIKKYSSDKVIKILINNKNNLGVDITFNIKFYDKNKNLIDISKIDGYAEPNSEYILEESLSEIEDFDFYDINIYNISAERYRMSEYLNRYLFTNRNDRGY